MARKKVKKHKTPAEEAEEFADLERRTLEAVKEPYVPKGSYRGVRATVGLPQQPGYEPAD